MQVDGGRLADGVKVLLCVLYAVVPPRWKIEPEDSSVVLGHGVVVDCQSDGDPAPTVTWNRHDGTSTAHSVML